MKYFLFNLNSNISADETKDDPSTVSERYSQETKSVLSIDCTVDTVNDDNPKRHVSKITKFLINKNRLWFL